MAGVTKTAFVVERGGGGGVLWIPPLGISTSAVKEEELSGEERDHNLGSQYEHNALGKSLTRAPP